MPHQTSLAQLVFEESVNETQVYECFRLVCNTREVDGVECPSTPNVIPGIPRRTVKREDPCNEREGVRLVELAVMAQ